MTRRRSILPRWSVRVRILGAILVVTALGLGGAGAATYLIARMANLASVDNQLETRVSAARAVADSQVFTTPDATLFEVIRRVLPSANETSLGIVDGRVKYFPASFTGLALDRDAGFAARAAAHTSGGRVWLGTDVLPEGRIRYIAVPIRVPGSTQNGVYIDAVNLDSELKPLTSAFSIFALVAVIALFAIGLVGWFVAGRLLRPIRRLRTAASSITASDLGERIPVVGSDDVSDLTETINEMFDRLDTAMTSQRQLLDDVRHELKTPITILRGHLELLDAANARDVDATRALAIDELDRMSGLVDDIEALAETQREVLALRPTDVSDLTRDVFAKVSILPGHDWKLGETANAVVPLDAARITQAWLQLADNAAKYSPVESTVELGSRVSDGAVEFWIQDAGTGIPEEQWGRIFERFGRVDTGRGIRGSGLGLPIVAAIAAGHGGRVSLASSPAGSRFGIRIPLADDTEQKETNE